MPPPRFRSDEHADEDGPGVAVGLRGQARRHGDPLPAPFEAGYPKGFDAVEVATDAVYVPEAVINGLRGVGIRARLRPLERAGFCKADTEKWRESERASSA